jgi:hypothetical protein
MRDRIAETILSRLRDRHEQGGPLNSTAVKRHYPDLITWVYEIRGVGWKEALEVTGIDYASIAVELLPACQCRLCGQKHGILTAQLASVYRLKPSQYLERFLEADLMAESPRVKRMWNLAPALGTMLVQGALPGSHRGIPRQRHLGQF